MLRTVLFAQATYYSAAGLWPLVAYDAFERVTGPKVDDWLVRMVGLLAVAIGTTLFVGARSPAVPADTLWLSVTSAASFAAVDLAYGIPGRIRPIYVAEAVVEIALIALVLAGRKRRG